MIEELKKEIQLKFGKEILSRGDCEELSEIIYQNTKKNINYNTLRRLFGLAKGTTPRKYTLNLLSEFVGYQSYNDFFKRYNTIDDWREWENVFDILDNHSTDELIYQLSKERRQGRDFINIIILVCRELLIRKNYDSFIKLINQPWLSFNSREYNHVIMLGNSIGTLLRKEQIPDSVQIDFLRSKNYIDLIYKIYVDYSSFNRNYGKQVDYVYENLNLYDKETQIFTTAVKILKETMTKGIISGRLLEKKIPKISYKLHPILIGRLYSLKLTFSKNNEILNRRILREFEEIIIKNPNRISEYLYEVMNLAFFLNDFVLFEFIFNLIHSKNINPLYWYHNYHYLIIRLVIIYYYLHRGEKQKAKQLIVNLKPQSYRGSFKRYHGLFFHIANYHLTEKPKVKLEILETFINQARTMRYQIINKDYILNYFSPNFKSPYNS